jgi:uncharacterized protein YciI
MTIEEIIAKGKQYTLVLLKKGANYDNMEPDILRENHMAHLQHLFSLRDQGILAINGPVTDECDIVGVSIYNSADKKEVESYVIDDPGVKAGRFDYEIYSWFSIPGDKLG